MRKRVVVPRRHENELTVADRLDGNADSRHVDVERMFDCEKSLSIVSDRAAQRHGTEASSSRLTSRRAASVVPKPAARQFSKAGEVSHHRRVLFCNVESDPLKEGVDTTEEIVECRSVGVAEQLTSLRMLSVS